MTEFPLTIVTPGGPVYDGPVRQLTVRTASGDLTVLPRHADLSAALAPGNALVVTGQRRRTARCSGGLLQVRSDRVTLLCSRFQWSE